MSNRLKVLEEIKNSTAEYAVYGDLELESSCFGTRQQIIEELESIDDREFGDQHWYPCDENANVTDKAVGIYPACSLLITEGIIDGEDRESVQSFFRWCEINNLDNMLAKEIAAAYRNASS